MAQYEQALKQVGIFPIVSALHILIFPHRLKVFPCLKMTMIRKIFKVLFVFLPLPPWPLTRKGVERHLHYQMKLSIFFWLPCNTWTFPLSHRLCLSSLYHVHELPAALDLLFPVQLLRPSSKKLEAPYAGNDYAGLVFISVIVCDNCSSQPQKKTGLVLPSRHFFGFQVFSKWEETSESVIHKWFSWIKWPSDPQVSAEDFL